jgi:iron(III) transport system substrate-binding protein
MSVQASGTCALASAVAERLPARIPTCAEMRRALLRFSAPALGLVLVACFLTLSGIARAEPGATKRFPAPAGSAAAPLRIHGSTDLEVFASVIADYQKLHPDVEVIYTDTTAQEMQVQYLRNPRRAHGPDLMISSGMDLQAKLVNDGHALAHRSERTEQMPDWAQWRHEAFAISYEPLAIVYNTALLPADRVPRTRRQLLDLLRAPDGLLDGRIGTYDAVRSSVGYLAATQDAQRGTISGALLAALGDNHVVLEESSAALLDRVADGRLLIAYNGLGSYAKARAEAGQPLGLVYPEDYTLVALRTALIPRTAAHPALAHAFLNYLLSPRGQQVLEREAHLIPVMPGEGSGGSVLRDPSFRPIPLGPGLLVYLDALKRRQFLEGWRGSVNQASAP